MLIPDFSRKVYCVLGLPFDAVDMTGSVQKVRSAVARGTPCFVSTPNLNYAIAAQGDAAFRDSVWRSDLSIADGMPLVWAARLLGAPLPERVPGSGLFEHLRRPASRPIKVFFFGGDEGIAAKACERLNAENSGLRCVGYESPGFGSVEAMSDDATIQRINASAPDFIAVSVGARKGQAWIERNRHRFAAPIIAYLGATLNFVAGSVRRAPDLMQGIGLEWVWRIKQEPSLWRRYASDGGSLLRLTLTRLIPGALHARLNRPGSPQTAAAEVLVVREGPDAVLRLSGAWTAANAASLQPALAEAASVDGKLQIDVRNVTHIDTALIALLGILWAFRLGAGKTWDISDATTNVRRSFKFACAEYVLLSAKNLRDE